MTFDSLERYVQGTVSEYVRVHFGGAVQLPSGSASMGSMVLAKIAAAPTPVPSQITSSPEQASVKPKLTPEQQQAANTQLVGLWTDPNGILTPNAKSVTTDDVKQALSAGADANAIDKNGLTALQNAALYGETGVVQVLLAAGANVNAAAANGFTALMDSVLSGNIETVRALLAARANVNTKAAFGPGPTPLGLAAMVGSADIVRSLLTAGANVNAVANDGVTPLMVAAQNSHYDALQALLAAGASVDARDSDGRTALWDAENPYGGTAADRSATIAALKAAGAKE